MRHIQQFGCLANRELRAEWSKHDHFSCADVPQQFNDEFAQRRFDPDRLAFRSCNGTSFAALQGIGHSNGCGGGTFRLSFIRKPVIKPLRGG